MKLTLLKGEAYAPHFDLLLDSDLTSVIGSGDRHDFIHSRGSTEDSKNVSDGGPSISVSNEADQRDADDQGEGLRSDVSLAGEIASRGEQHRACGVFSSRRRRSVSRSDCAAHHRRRSDTVSLFLDASGQEEDRGSLCADGLLRSSTSDELRPGWLLAKKSTQRNLACWAHLLAA